MADVERLDRQVSQPPQCGLIQVQVIVHRRAKRGGHGQHAVAAVERLGTRVKEGDVGDVVASGVEHLELKGAKFQAVPKRKQLQGLKFRRPVTRDHGLVGPCLLQRPKFWDQCLSVCPARRAQPPIHPIVGAILVLMPPRKPRRHPFIRQVHSPWGLSLEQRQSAHMIDVRVGVEHVRDRPKACAKLQVSDRLRERPKRPGPPRIDHKQQPRLLVHVSIDREVALGVL